MENLQWIACELLSCWYLDLHFLDELIWAYDIDLDIEELQMIYWKIDNINILIYEAYEQVKNMFIEDNEEAINVLWFSTNDFEAWREYEIFTNYLDSHLWFNDEELDNLYEDWRKD